MTCMKLKPSFVKLDAQAGGAATFRVECMH